MLERYFAYIELTGNSPYTYFTRYVLPLTVLLVLFTISMHVFLSPVVDPSLSFVPLMFALAVSFLILAVLLLYPYIVAESVRNEIENNLHLFVTHMAALATCDVPPNELFRAISLKKEYGALSRVAGEIYMRFAVWHVTLGDSCKISARATPSKVLSDFLDRFSSALDSGEDLQEFLNEEQTVVMSEYTIRYRGALYDVDVLKDVFISIVITLVFLLSFIVIMPFLTGIDAGLLLGLVMLLYIGIEIAMAYYIKSVLPEDKIWNERFTSETMKQKLLPQFFLSLFLCVLLGVLLFNTDLPNEIKVALIVTPLIIVGKTARDIEETIKRVDQFFVEFIVSLGLGITARGGLVVESLKTITMQDFGPLTFHIKNLFERLKTRINPQKSWLLFQMETGSFLMNKFTSIFVEGIEMGGKANKIATMIGKNFMQLQTLRRERYNATGSTIGIMYGLQAGVVFSVYVAGGIVSFMDGMYSRINVPEEVVSSILFRPPAGTVELISNTLILSYVIHALFSAIIIRLSDGGNLLNSLLHFVAMVWLGSIVALVVQMVMGSLMPLPEPII